jgi:hypothetical protein
MRSSPAVAAGFAGSLPNHTPAKNAPITALFQLQPVDGTARVRPHLGIEQIVEVID